MNRQPFHVKKEEHKSTVTVGLSRMLNVMHAVILRDIRSRYFDHGLGFLIVPLFPVAHMMLLLLIYKVVDRQAVFGDDLVLFFATGLIPVLTFNYVSRFMSVSVLANKSMLAFPAIRLLDIVLGRSMLELVAIVISIIIVLTILVSVGSNPVPRSMGDAVLAIFCVAILSIGVGIAVSVVTAIFPFFGVFYALFTAIIYLSSGAPIYLHAFPDIVLYYCSFNPAFQAVEWVRSAYYLGYSEQYLSKTYLLGWAFGSLAIGLLMERLLRRQILNG
ncbi:ABC transporter permease [Agrobacterium rubi]|uniref:ABC transporter permease n=1 Tax=Agrobacterium rubi TaxID=28099 RepID=UPI00157355BA|nr:ABC transporter permease [Agrobacterium rubi]NTF11078.1 ABC transporter permease [Agrobacterium rubi]NTF23451.1 ABC transporter permease [Agrobacterium rubi]NTF30404.1 ABC transporter permease [Agrobacterium rubi]